MRLPRGAATDYTPAEGGITRPSDLAIVRLTTNLNLVESTRQIVEQFKTSDA